MHACMHTYTYSKSESPRTLCIDRTGLWNFVAMAGTVRLLRTSDRWPVSFCSFLLYQL